MIGIFGGSFDPVHCGHLRAALDVLETVDLEYIRFIPVGQAVHRPPLVLSTEQRLACLERALADQPGFVLDRCEIDDPRPSYMVYTLESLQEKWGKKMALLLGMDAFNHFLSWHRPDRILELAHLIIMSRPDYQPATAIQALLSKRQVFEPQSLNKKRAGCIYLCPVTPLSISSTDIRQKWQRSQSIRYLVPDAVWHYLKNQL